MAKTELKINTALHASALVEEEIKKILVDISQLMGVLSTTEFYYCFEGGPDLDATVASVYHSQSKLEDIKNRADKGISALQDAVQELSKEAAEHK